MTDYKKFWKTVKPIFSSKKIQRNNIALIQGTGIIQEKEELPKTFNEFFVSVAKILGINGNLLSSSSETKNVEPVSVKFENHL